MNKPNHKTYNHRPTQKWPDIVRIFDEYVYPNSIDKWSPNHSSISIYCSVVWLWWRVCDVRAEPILTQSERNHAAATLDECGVRFIFWQTSFFDWPLGCVLWRCDHEDVIWTMQLLKTEFQVKKILEDNRRISRRHISWESNIKWLL